MDNIVPGLMGEARTIVDESLTARAIGSGDLPVYGTPAMIALMEAAAVAAIEEHLGAGQASVGIEISVQHLAATPAGEEVRARAEVTHVEGRKVEFLVQAWDEKELVGDGHHVRFVIDIERFMKRLEDNNAS
ncbi:MAG: thioesterase family protein [Anaerolineae bacterium]